MNRYTRIGLSVGGVLMTASLAPAAVIMNDNMEYADQAAFQAAWTPIGTVAPLSLELSTEQASSPIKSAKAPATATSNQSRNQRTFAETSTVFALAPGNSIIWSYDFYDSITGNPQRNYSNLQDGTGPGTTPPGQLLSIGLNNNQVATDSGGNYYMARVLGFAHPAVDVDGGPNESAGGTGSGAYFKLNDFGAGLRSIGWHNLKIVLSTDDGNSLDLDFYVDNVLAEREHNIGTATSLRSYDVIRMGSGLSNGAANAYFDNMYLEVVPEPASLGVIALGGIALLRRRRI